MFCKNQKGFTLIELSAALIVMGMITAAAVPQLTSFMQDRKIYNDSAHTKIVGDAAASYIADNYSSIMAVATPTQPALITVPMLIASGYLEGGTSTQNTFSQTMCALVKEPTAGKLQGLLVTEGGDTINDFDLSLYAGGLGGAGGLVSSINPTQVTGVGGSWTIPVSDFHNVANDAGQTCSGAAGNVQVAAGHSVMALWFEAEDQTAGVLYRNAVASRPELNRMNVAIDMNGNNIDGAGVITATTGSFSGLTSTTGTINTFNATTANISGTATANRVDTSIIYDKDNVAYYLNPASTSRVNLLRPNYIETQTTVTEGTGCAPNGRISKDATGKLLSCQSGIWTGGGIGAVSFSSIISANSGQTITSNLSSKSHCSLSYFFKDSKFQGSCRVYKSGSVWYLQAYKAAGADGAATQCQAVCF